MFQTVLVSKSEGQTYYVPPNFKEGPSSCSYAPARLQTVTDTLAVVMRFLGHMLRALCGFVQNLEN